MKNKLLISRILLIAGLGVGLKSWWQTLSHVGDETYLLVSEFTKGDHHAWYHAFREAIGDLGAMIILLLIFFGASKWRTIQTWYLSLIIMLAYYAPFWIGTPFVPELAAPHLTAELIHIFMAVPSILALGLAKKSFSN